MRINYDFYDLEAFLAVKETGSFHLAAERLHLSQSAVTRRVQKLETALDTVLFERTTREVRPTLAAKRLQVRAQAILEDARETTLAMRDESVAFAHQRNAVVTIAVIPTVVAALLPRAIKRFRAKGNAARIRLLDHTANAVAESVAKAEADFGLCSIPALEPNTRFEPLFDDQIVLVLPKDHPLTAQHSVIWSDIEGEDLIVPTRGTGNRLLIDEAMARSRRPLRWTYEIRRSTTALDLVLAGVGIALLPRSAIAHQAGTALTYRPITRPEIIRPVGFLTRIGQQDTGSVQALMAEIRHEAANPAEPV